MEKHLKGENPLDQEKSCWRLGRKGRFHPFPGQGLELLNCFDEEHLTLSLTDFSNITGLSVSTISRILQTLVKMGYLNREVDRKYTLGHQVFRLMGILSNSSNLRATARPILQNLRDIFNETASLYVVRDDMRVCLESVESTQALHRAVSVGEMLPLYRGAVGYVLLGLAAL